MRLTDPGFPAEEVLEHPQHQAAQPRLVELIEQLRACAGPADGYEFQRALLDQVLQAQKKRAAFSQVVKRLRDRGRRPQPDAPAIESGRDPAKLETWVFERELWERISRQYRSIGDAMAWRAFGFRRQFILALCRNHAPGDMAGKAGLAAERARVEQAWAEGKFAILHDLTNCLRIGDVTVFSPDGPPVTEEIKTDPRRRNSTQLRRIQEVREAVWNGSALPGDDPRQRLLELPIRFETNLDLLREAADHAAGHGIAALAAPGSRVVSVIDQYGLMAAGITTKTFPALFEQTYAPALRSAGIDGQRDFNVLATSMDSAALNPLRVPWAVYPLHPALCARLIGDIATFQVETCGLDLARQVAAAGVPARWVLPPGRGGELQVGQVVMEMTRTTSIPLGSGYRLESELTLQMSRSELDRYLIELIDPGAWTAGIHHMLDTPPPADQPWPHYRDEDGVWE